jgi:hypothetical protein
MSIRWDVKKKEGKCKEDQKEKGKGKPATEYP